MVEIKSELKRIEKYDSYLIEVQHPDYEYIDNEITTALSDNREDIGISLDDGVYVKIRGSDSIKNFLQKTDLEYNIETMPWLILLDTHPNNVEVGDDLVVVELGEYSSKSDVTSALQKVSKAVQDDEFMRELSPSDRASRLRDIIPVVNAGTAVAANIVTLATIVA